MKLAITYTILSVILLILTNCVSEPDTANQSQVEKTNPFINPPKQGSLNYALELNKSSYVYKEEIKITLHTINNTNKEQAIWIDGGSYPIGNGIKLYNKRDLSPITDYWSFLSSTAYTLEQVEELKTHISRDETFTKEYHLNKIFRLENRTLEAGEYFMYYDDKGRISDTVYFEVIVNPSTKVS